MKMMVDCERKCACKGIRFCAACRDSERYKLQRHGCNVCILAVVNFSSFAFAF